MFTFNQHLLLACLLAAQPFAVQAESPGLGVPTSEAVIREAFVFLDGQGLPEGNGDAATGATLFNQHCLRCHGIGGDGGINDTLTGGQGSLATGAPVKTIGSYWPFATTLFDYIRRAMPYNSPGILSPDEVYSITAYLLYVNDIVAADKNLDSTSLPQIQMPNRSGFDSAL
jgi:cytochrome c